MRRSTLASLLPSTAFLSPIALLSPIVVSLSLAAGVAHADETTVCKAGDLQRIITVTSDDKGCQVNYTKGDTTTKLWYSSHMEYCTARATEFIEKQKGWGFTCTTENTPASDTN